MFDDILTRVDDYEQFYEKAPNEDEKTLIRESIEMHKNNIKSIMEAMAKNLQELCILASEMKMIDYLSKPNKNTCEHIILSDEFVTNIPSVIK